MLFVAPRKMRSFDTCSNNHSSGYLVEGNLTEYKRGVRLKYPSLAMEYLRYHHSQMDAGVAQHQKPHHGGHTPVYPPQAPGKTPHCSRCGYLGRLYAAASVALCKLHT